MLSARLGALLPLDSQSKYNDFAHILPCYYDISAWYTKSKAMSSYAACCFYLAELGKGQCKTMGFIDTLIEGLEEGFDKAFEKHETTQGAARVLLKAEEQEGWISSDEFLEAYNARTYNSDNGQYDIKIMKNYDFEGGYVLWNRSRNFYHTGIGAEVYKKVERQFRGFGHEGVYKDFKDGDTFVLTLFRLRDTEYDDIQRLGNDLRKAFGQYPIPKIADKGQDEGLGDKSEPSGCAQAAFLGCVVVGLMLLLYLA